jgi:hypothetical protein
VYQFGATVLLSRFRFCVTAAAATATTTTTTTTTTAAAAAGVAAQCPNKRSLGRFDFHIFSHVGRGSVGGVARRYGLDCQGIECWLGRDFPHQSSPALGHFQRPVQWVQGLFPRGKAAEGVVLTTHPNPAPRFSLSFLTFQCIPFSVFLSFVDVVDLYLYFCQSVGAFSFL